MQTVSNNLIITLSSETMCHKNWKFIKVLCNDDEYFLLFMCESCASSSTLTFLICIKHCSDTVCISNISNITMLKASIHFCLFLVKITTIYLHNFAIFSKVIYINYDWIFVARNYKTINIRTHVFLSSKEKNYQIHICIHMLGFSLFHR